MGRWWLPMSKECYQCPDHTMTCRFTCDIAKQAEADRKEKKRIEDDARKKAYDVESYHLIATRRAKLK
jgi:hypothetical protein